MTEEKVEIEQFPSNSGGKLKEEPEPEEESKKIVKQVATGKRIVKKKTFWDTMLNGTLKVVGSYLLFEILIPAAKNMVSDMINNGSDMILFGETKSRRRDRERGRGSSYVSYTSYYDRDRDRGDRPYDRERRDRVYGRSRFDSDEILLPSREEAEEVIQSMFDIYDQYNAVTVSEFLELVGLPDEYTDRNYGWTNLRDIQARRVRDGYIIDLPVPKALPR
ncbi:MAG TPA: hypothetical protein VF870_08725 [Ignavibacteriaceae bacterium]